MIHLMMSRRSQLRPLTVLIAALVTACGGSSGDSPRTNNTLPSIQLDDGQVLGNGSSILRIPATDDTGISSVAASVRREGRLPECEGEIDLSLARDTLFEACLADQPTCSVEFIPSTNDVVVYPPPLYAPIGLEYELSFTDRDGASTQPVNAVFCFDVGLNIPPVAAADTYQLVYPSTIQRNGVVYNSRCEKQPGSDGVLLNDDDDEHITNRCLQAELVDLPRFATNLSTFRNTFRSDGGFRYEGLTDAPTADSFSYRVTDGVNPPSAPIRVDIVFSGDNNPPVAVDDDLTIDEDSEPQAINVLSNDSDPDALPLSVRQINNGPFSGTADIRNGVIIEYQPNADFNGNDSFNYIVVDSAGVTDTGTVRIQVTPVNDPPQAVTDEVTTDENTNILVNVVANDSDLEGDELTVSSVTKPVNGSASVQADGRVLYSPDPDFSGIDAFEYTVSDGNGLEDTATVRVTVINVNVAPEPGDDSFFTSEGQAIVLSVLDNDVDGDGDALVIDTVSSPSNGAAVIQGSTIVYTPNDTFSGTDQFTYTVSDGNGETGTATVSVVVSNTNKPPVAGDDQVTTEEDDPVSFAPLTNDTDPDGDVLSVVSVTEPNSGTTRINANRIVYSPESGFFGSDTFQYTIEDSDGATATAVVVVTVTSGNNAPDAEDDTAQTDEGESVLINVLANDTDEDADPLAIESVGAANNGVVSIQGSSVLYEPADGFSGSDTFTYTVVDSDGLSDSATVTVTVSDVNSAPLAVDDSAGTEEGTAVSVSVLANDTDADGDALSVESAGDPANGTVIVQGNVIVYAPEEDFSGTDQFTYTVSDGNGGTDTASVSIVVSNTNAPPVAVDDLVSTEEDDTVTFDPLVNDTDPDGDALTVTSVTDPENGSTSVDDNSIVYSPDAGYFGSDTFQYTISDSEGAVSTATVDVTVTSSNSAPVAQDDTAQTDEGKSVTIAVLANDADADNDPLSLDSVSTAGNGTVSIQGDSVVYVPADEFAGTDTFNYTVVDTERASDTATVTVSVAAVNAPPVAGDDNASTLEESAVTIDVLSNDTDPDGDTLTLDSVGSAANGDVSVDGNSAVYSPADDFSGTDSFTYVVVDENGLSDTGNVTITVTDVNSIPNAEDDSAVTDESVAVTIDVLANDTDEDGDSLSIDSVNDPNDGTAVIQGDAVVYTPDEGFTGTDEFGYTLSDGQGGTATGSVSVLVNNVNEPPVASNDSVVTEEDNPVSFDPLANDTDPDGDELSVVSVTQPGNGIAEMGTGNSIVYSPAAKYSGADSFQYSIEDSSGATATASVAVTVESTNTIPVAADDVAETDQGVSVTVDVLINDNDADGDTLAIIISTPPTNGAATVVDQSIVYTPTDEFVGDDTLEYSVDDGNGGVDSAIVLLTVSAPNTAPIAVADTAATTVDTPVSIAVLDNDTDADGDALSITINTPPFNGTAVVSDRAIVYTPSADFSGEDTFEYGIDDGNGGSGAAMVLVAISALNTTPVAQADAVDTIVDTPVTISVLANDTDADSDSLIISGVTQPANGTSTIDGSVVIYTPATAFVGTDRFDYTISDGNGGEAVAAVSVEVEAINSPPLAIADSATTVQATSIIIAVLDNDTDADADELVVSSVSAPLNGTTEIAANAVVYTPAELFTGEDSFDYVVTDGNGGTDSASVLVTVNAINNPPLAANDSAATPKDQPVTIAVLDNDSDPDLDTLTISAVSAENNGTASVSQEVIIFTPEPGFIGDGSFDYEVNDGNGGSDTASVTIAIVSANSAPIVSDDTLITQVNTSATIDVLSNDTDPDADALSIVAVTAPDNGIAEVSAEVVIYTPDLEFTGNDSFDYTIEDSAGDADTGTVFVTVEPLTGTST